MLPQKRWLKCLVLNVKEMRVDIKKPLEDIEDFLLDINNLDSSSIMSVWPSISYIEMQLLHKCIFKTCYQLSKYHVKHNC